MQGADALGLLVTMCLQRRIVLTALLIGGAGAAAAYTEPVLPPARPATTPVAVVQAASAISMDQAVKMAEQQFHARVVKAETEHDNGRTVYVLRLLNDAGRVWTVRVDAANGTLL
jgi:Peptidase propeptide and YPEB domain